MTLEIAKMLGMLTLVSTQRSVVLRNMNQSIWLLYAADQCEHHPAPVHPFVSPAHATIVDFVSDLYILCNDNETHEIPLILL